jgi:hypothetical protein
MRKPSRVEFDPFSFLQALAEHFGEKCARVHAVRGIMRASVNATRFFQVRAQIARSCFLLDGRLLAAGMFGIVSHHFKWMQIDIPVRAVARA